MKKMFFCVCGVILTLFGVSCERNGHDTSVAVAQPHPPSVSQTLTLSGNQLIYLDWDGRLPSRAKVVGKRIVDDSAVEFDIHFPSNRPSSRSINYVSSGTGGRGVLIGSDVSAYKAFALKFTLVSVDEARGPDLPQEQELVVGAVIGPTVDGELSSYTPVTLSGTSGRTTAVSTISVVGQGKIYQIGIHAHMVKPEDWSPSGSMVTIRVESAENAAVPPWP